MFQKEENNNTTSSTETVADTKEKAPFLVDKQLYDDINSGKMGIDAIHERANQIVDEYAKTTHYTVEELQKVQQKQIGPILDRAMKVKREANNASVYREQLYQEFAANG